jgi:ABC-2 type transport system permease protein
MNKMAILLRRELWGNPAITVAPAIIGGLLLVMTILAVAGAISISVGDDPVDVVDAIKRVDPGTAGPLMQMALASLSVTFNTVMILVITFYLLDSLYADRKDRSILFWKSLPVSDTQIVLSKLATAALVIPAITLVIYLITAVVIYLISGSAVAFAGSTAVLEVGPGALLETAVTLLYALLVQSLWYLPIFGWLLLASAWAKRAVLLWAILPPVVLMLIEDMVFRTSTIAQLLGDRVVGVFPLAFRHRADGDFRMLEHSTTDGDMHITAVDGLTSMIQPGALLASPGLYGGFVVAALFIAGAIWLRRYRDES